MVLNQKYYLNMCIIYIFSEYITGEINDFDWIEDTRFACLDFIARLLCNYSKYICI